MNALHSYIDHTTLKPIATLDDVKILCDEAVEHRFKAVCIPPYAVAHARAAIAGKTVEICSVVGFPLGYHDTSTKLHEASSLLSAGATEIDMVVNLSALKSKSYSMIEQEVREMVHLVKEERGAILKLIFENSYLDADEIRYLCNVCNDTGVDFAKTSTGFAPTGAVLEEVALMRSELADAVGIKASGGIRTREQALAMIDAGASRIGTSSGLAIIDAV